MSVVRYGLLSTAQIGINAHLPALRKSENSEVVSISSRGSAKAKAAAEEHDIDRWYGSYEEQLADPEMDAVINSLPNGMHCEWTIKAAAAGKHILCEKPLAVTAAECRRMIDAAEANGVLLVEAFTHRWSGHLRLARQRIAEGAIGKVATLDSCLCFTIAEPEGNVRFSPELVGGGMWDAGCYAVYACRYVLDAEPVTVHAVSHDSGGWGVDTTFCGMMQFADGAIANCTASMEQPRRCTLSVDGSTGRIELPDMFDDEGPVLICYSDEREDEEVATPSPGRFVVQLNEFSECVLTGKSPEFPAADGLRNTAALEALYRAAESGRGEPVGGV